MSDLRENKLRLTCCVMSLQVLYSPQYTFLLDVFFHIADSIIILLKHNDIIFFILKKYILPLYNHFRYKSCFKKKNSRGHCTL